MGRHLEFNYDRALERAMAAFWAKGYSAASMRNLLKAMQIGEGSFYHLFGSKNRLYLLCLRHYNETVNRQRLVELQAEPSVRKGLRNFFKGLLHDVDNPRKPHVCLMSRSLSSDVLDEAELAPLVIAEMKLLETSICDRLEQAKKTGELPPQFPAKITAELIFTFLQGYFRVVKVLKAREEMWQQIETFLARLGL